VSRAVCPECHLSRHWEWFTPLAFCGSPTVHHTLCRPCQEALRLVWAKHLANYFDSLVREGRLAA